MARPIPLVAPLMFDQYDSVGSMIAIDPRHGRFDTADCEGAVLDRTSWPSKETLG